MKRQIKKEKRTLRERWRIGFICAIIALGISGYSLEIEKSVTETSTAQGTDASIERAKEDSANIANLTTTVKLTKKADLTLKAKTTKSTKVTMGQKNALKKAKTYLSFSSFSKKGLIKQLEFEGFSNKEAKYAADKCGANWKKQALSKAKSYLDLTAFSYKGLIKQLEFEGFTSKQATYAVDNCKANWKKQAVKKAKSYLELTSFSKSGLIEQLKFEGFTDAEAKYGVKAVGY